MATRKQAEHLLAHHRTRLLRYPNVVAVAIGRKKTGDEVRDRGWCVRVHVARKTKRPGPRSVPRVLKPPPRRKWLGEIETDVVETGGTELHAGERPDVRPGYGLRVNEKGVVSCLVEDGAGQSFALTVGHIVSRQLVVDRNRNGGLPLDSQPECFVFAPTLSETFVGPCVRCSDPDEIMDLALVLLTVGRPRPIPQIKGVRHIKKEPLKPEETLRIMRADKDLIVRFHREQDQNVHATFTYGDVPVTYADLVAYPRSGDGGRLEGGDSGSPVVDKERRLVGVHIGASQGGDASLPLGYALRCSTIARWQSDLRLRASAGLFELS